MSPSHPLDIAALERGRIHLIEANAGTGKTYAIANLCLRFVLEGVAVRELLVVTFTRAATDELRGRIRARIEAARRVLTGEEVVPCHGADPFFEGLPARYPPGPERDQALLRLELALYDIHEAAVHTIHGFCQQALADQAFASGQLFELEAADDTALRERVLRDWWRLQTYPARDEAFDVFLQAAGSFARMTAHMDWLLRAGGPELHPPPPEADHLQALEGLVRDALARLARQWRAHGQAARALLLEHKALSRRATNGQKPEDLEPVLNALDHKLRADPPRLPQRRELERIARSQLDFKPTGTHREDFDRAPFTQADELLDCLLELERQRGLHLMARMRDHARRRLTELKTRRGLLAYDDMILRLHEALHAGDERARTLAERLAERHPVILVDEFQDTDPLQYAIFARIHAAAKDHALILIGDPKQAIYGFRGGDIFTYMQARDEADQHWNLATNWRSTPELIAAVNHLFSGERPFAYETISYAPSAPAPEPLRKARPLRLGGQTLPALVVQELSLGENGKPLSKERAGAYVREAVAQRIAELLSHPAARLGDHPLQPGDIAILVRTHREGTALRQALLQRGIRSVSVGQERIWQTPEAEGLQWLLQAALLPEDRALARQALAAPFLALPPEALHALVTDPERWGTWVERLHEAHELWRRRGFMAAFQGLLDALAGLHDPAPEPLPDGWLARLPDPERTLTNLLHLAELLQEAAREHAGGEALLAWMRRQGEDTRQDEHLLRLESDEDLVQIATIHAAKGLQYPVVFLTDLWSCRPVHPRGENTLRWHERRHDGGFIHYYQPWIAQDDPHLARADRERLAEDLRLAYVALTRAESHCHVFFGPAGDAKHPGHAGNTALAWLLSDRSADLEHDPFAGEIGFERLEPCAHIARLAPRPLDPPRRLDTPRAAAETLAAARIERSVRTDWRIASFTALTRDVHQATQAPAATGAEDFALAYPAGARVGRFLHALLEQIDPVRPLEPQLRELAPRAALRYGLDPEQDFPGLAGWLGDVLHTPLQASGPCLAELDPRRQLRELPFDFGTGRVDPGRLDALLAEAAGPARPPLRFERFQGLVTGVIDLVFEHGGRYYLADYKSNLLGRRLEDYAPERLAAEIAARRYDLQYLLYTLALHRHLRLRLADYDYERHFGGVYYLFLRGMRPAHGPSRGVFHARPPAALVHALDTEIFALPEARP